MKIKELIKHLQKFDCEMEVTTDASNISEIKFKCIDFIIDNRSHSLSYPISDCETSDEPKMSSITCLYIGK